MGKFCSGLIFAFFAALVSLPSHAAESFDISSLAGFQRNGAPSIFGNGYVYLSPVYAVGYGATVNFGTAILGLNGPDGRTGCYFHNNCYGNYSWAV